jgi:prephenate dehydrogenase
VVNAEERGSRDGRPRRIAFLGFGLIAGSIARAIRGADTDPPELVAWSPTGAGARAAAADGMLDVASEDAGTAIDGSDLVVLAGPPPAVLTGLDELAGGLAARLGADATVTDVASTKAEIVARAADHRIHFVGGHPMAGRETSGYASADPNLFSGRPWVLVAGPDARPLDSARVGWLALACGARPLEMDALTHDAAVAGISHLPLVVAAALVEAVVGGHGGERSDWPAASELAASGWRDMTRLARGDVAMGAGILETNAAAVARRLRDLRGVIDAWIVELERGPGPDTERLAERLRLARERLR